MVIKIQTQSTGIPIEIGNLQYEFDTSDKSLESLVTNHAKIARKLEAIKGNDIATAKEVLKEGFEFILGKGTFEEIYEQTPSIIKCADQLLQLVEAISEELSGLNQKMSQQQIAENYLKHKKPKQKKKNRK